MSLVIKIKEMLKDYQEQHGPLDDKDYTKMFVHFYLQHEDEYLKETVKTIRSDGKVKKK